MAGVLGVVAVGCGRGIDEAAAGVTTPTSQPSTTTSAAPATTEPPVVATELVVWVPLRARAAVQEAATTFTTATGIGVVIDSVELSEMESAISSGVGPDIFMGRHTWLARLAPRGLAVPAGLEARLEDFVEVAGEAFTYEDITYGAPATMESIALFYNSNVVTSAPGAFSEIKEACLQIRGGDVTTTTVDSTTTTVAAPLGAGCLEYLVDDARVGLALVTAGDGYLYRRVEGQHISTDVGLTTDAAVSRAATLRSLVADGVVAGADDRAEMVARFASGETPFLIGDIELAEALSSSATPFGVSRLPIITGTTPRPFVEVNGFMVAGRSDQQQTALLFLSDYLATPSTMADVFGASTGLPAYRATADLIAGDQVLAGLQAAAEAGDPMPTVDGIDDVLAALGATLASILDAEGPDVEAILSEAAQLALSLAA